MVRGGGNTGDGQTEDEYERERVRGRRKAWQEEGERGGRERRKIIKCKELGEQYAMSGGSVRRWRAEVVRKWKL